MSIMGLFVGFCYAMLFVRGMGEQFLICGLCGLIGLILDMIMVRISMYIQRKKVMKRIRKNRKQGLTKTTPSAIIKSQKRGNTSKGKEVKNMFNEEMMYGATIEDLLKEVGLTEEEVFGEEK